MKIITITINPAYDIHIMLDGFSLGKDIYCKDYLKETGGKGINISKSLANNGVENEAYVLLGKDNSSKAKKDLIHDKLHLNLFEYDGDIRENYVIHCDGKETKLNLEKFDIKESDVQLLFDKLINKISNYTFVTFSGRVPKSIRKEFLIENLIRLSEKCNYLILDSSSFSYDEIKRIKPYLIKPNYNEILEILGLKAVYLNDFKNIIKDKFDYCNVLLSLGEKGGIVKLNDILYKVDVPKIQVQSTVGAGDNCIAGYLYGKNMKCSDEETIKYAFSFGCAKCLEKGNEPPKLSEIEKIKSKIVINHI